MRQPFKLLSLLCLLAGPPALGELLRAPYVGLRPAGMGNAFLALSDDSNALWYNPAGLARIDDYHFNLVDTSVGVDGLDTLARMGGALFNGAYDQVVRPDRQWMRFNFRPTYTGPYFSFTVFNHLNSFIDLNDLNTLAGTADIFAFNDLGAAAAIGIPMGPYLSVGATVRGFVRTGVDAYVSSLELAQQFQVMPTDLESAAFQSIQNMLGMGLGIGVDLGAMATVPLPNGYPRWTFAAVMNDVGMTSFSPFGMPRAPRPVAPTVHFGTALEYENVGIRRSKIKLAFDFRNFFDDAVLIKKLGAGIEFQTRIFSLRGGIWQGYPTAGVSVEFPPHTRLHIATYAAELGEALWQRSQRWYMMQLIIGFNPN